MAEQSKENCAESRIQTTRKFLIHEVTSEKPTSFITDFTIKAKGNSTENICQAYSFLSHARGFVMWCHTWGVQSVNTQRWRINYRACQSKNGSFLNVEYHYQINSANYTKCLYKQSIPNFQRTDSCGQQHSISEHADREAPPYLHRITSEIINCRHACNIH